MVAPQQETKQDAVGALHDLSNVMTALLYWLEKAWQELESGKQPTEAVGAALRQARHGRNIALSAMGAMWAQQAAEERTWQEFVREMEEDLRAWKGHERLRIELRGQTTRKLAGASVARQVLTNLLLNALVATEPEGRVTWTAEVGSNDFVRFVIEDEGPGFSEEQTKNLFSGIPSTRHPGKGTGLQQAKKLTTQMGGKLRLLRSRPHAAFELLWPLGREAGEAGRVEPGGERPRVLVVEDDENIRDLLASELKRRGMEATALESWEQAVRCLETEGAIWALLTDMSPLGQRAGERLEAVRSQIRGPVLMLTGSSEPAAWVDEGLVTAVVFKPFEVRDVVDRLASMLEEEQKGRV